METNTVIAAILKGELDDNLDNIIYVVRERKEALARATFWTLKPGDKVRFTQTVKPRYLAGQTGILVALRQKKVTVKLDDGPTGRFGGQIVTPVTLIEKVA